MAERCSLCHSIAHESFQCRLNRGNLHAADPVIPYPPEKSEERLKKIQEVHDQVRAYLRLPKELGDYQDRVISGPHDGAWVRPSERIPSMMEAAEKDRRDDPCDPEHLEQLAQTMTAKQRQAFYEHLYHKHGCRIFK